jgi:hypothetical protein
MCKWHAVTLSREKCTAAPSAALTDCIMHKAQFSHFKAQLLHCKQYDLTSNRPAFVSCGLTLPRCYLHEYVVSKRWDDDICMKRPWPVRDAIPPFTFDSLSLFYIFVSPDGFFSMFRNKILYERSIILGQILTFFPTGESI